jgi:hypothetical protein
VGNLYQRVDLDDEQLVELAGDITFGYVVGVVVKDEDLQSTFTVP